jgi:uncharacterized membrane protein
MNRGVGRFLLETWQLFYWSFFCPSLLQQRMKELNLWFFIQYFFISIILSLPLAVLTIPSGQGWDFRIWLAANFISYVLGALFLPSGIGFCIPLILALTYWQQAELFSKVFEYHPFATQILMNAPVELKMSISLILIGPVSILAGNNPILILVMFFAVFLFVCLEIFFEFGVAIYSAIFTISLPCFLLTSALVAFGCSPFRQKWLGIWIAITFVVLGWNNLSFNTLFTIPVSLIVYYRIFPDYLGAYFGSLVFQSLQDLLEFNQDSFLTRFFIFFFKQSLKNWSKKNKDRFLLNFHQILEDWDKENNKKGINERKSNPYFREILRKWFEFSQDSFLTKLPPYTTELIWLSVSNYQQILIDTFRRNPDLGLAIFKRMQAIPLRGSQLMIQGALPSIVANRFAAIRTTTELIDSITPLLPSLIPTFYKPEEITRFVETTESGNSEIDIVFFVLQRIVRDTVAALQSRTAALRERGLKQLVDQLKKLPNELSELGLKSQSVKSWQPAADRWQHILELEIAEQQKTSQVELLNPFQFGNPLRPNRNDIFKDRAVIFKGRQDFADRLKRLILDRNRPTLVLHGPRRAGKTSFLLNLPRLLPSDLVPIYLDMQQGSMTASEGDFCYGLVRAIDRDTRSQGLQLPPIPSRQDFATQPYPTLEDWLDLALPQLGERRLLLNLDEFEKIGSAIKDNRISERLFDQLRSMIQHYDRLGFLFSGVQTLEELGPRWSNYFISVVPMEMHYLESHEAEDLLLHPDPEFTLRYDTGIVAEILRLTRCQPYLLQLIGSAIVNQANLQHTQLATTTLLQAAIQDAFTNGEPYFTNIWTEFTGTTPAEVTAGQQILIALAQGNYLVETIDEATTAARRRLLRYHVIERDGDIDKIEIPLFEQWVRERSIGT